MDHGLPMHPSGSALNVPSSTNTPPTTTTATSSSSAQPSPPSTLVKLRDACVMLFTVGDRLRSAYLVPSKEPVRRENVKHSQPYIRAFVAGAGTLLALDVMRRFELSWSALWESSLKLL